MTNLEKIKTTLCNTINSMSEEELFEFLSDYDECEEPPFQKEILFTCSECHQTYGDCEIKLHDSDDYICLHRFINYCITECE